MKNKKELYDELQKQAPFLKKLKETDDGYLLPPGYLDDLEADVFRQLEAIGATRRPVTSPARPSIWQMLQRLWQPRMALALAGVLALVITAWWYFRMPHSPSPNQIDLAAAQISAEDAEDYLLDNLMRLEPEQIAMVLPEESLPVISLEPTGTTNKMGTQMLPSEIELSPEDLEDLLNDMTDEELKDLML